MNPDKQRIKIAEACGWELICPPGGMFFAYWQNGPIKAEDLPDYLNDLNAMQKAEKVLTQRQRTMYEMGLIAKRGSPCALYANAAERAEEFLRAIGKWEDET